MKSERPSFPRSAKASRRSIPGNDDHTLVESKCLACGQIVDTGMGQPLERRETAVAFPCPAAKKRPPDALDMDMLLQFSQQLYAHALTLQEVIRNEGEVTYELLRSRYDRQAAQQFEVFYRSSKRSPGFRKRGAGSCE